MLTLCLSLSAAIYGFMQRYMPTNRAIRWLRSPRGLKWAIPFALVATPSYLFAMVICTGIIHSGGPRWLHLLVLWSFWNATKFAAIAVLSIPQQLICVARSLILRIRTPRTVEHGQHGLGT